MDHIDIPSMPAPMVLLWRPTHSNTLPMTGINSSLYTIFNIDIGGGHSTSCKTTYFIYRPKKSCVHNVEEKA